MTASLETRCRDLVAELGLGDRSEVRVVVPLTGGVASDIARVDLPGRSYCVKFALAKLKVAEDWRAPVHRNAAEYAWLKVVAGVADGSVPRLFGRSEREHGFAMEYLDGPDILLWKAKLLVGTPEIADAAAVGDVLGSIHADSSAPNFDRAAFRNAHDFRALRLDPYLIFTASRHPEVAAKMIGMSDKLFSSDAVLVHGDVSPKNILLRNGVPVFLDAECATMGDASFDLAFCLNHLVLKSLHRPEHASTLHEAAMALWNAYRGHVTWEDVGALEARVTALLPMLMLARVDGKSPVEYLSPETHEQVRRLALSAIRAPSPGLAAFFSILKLETVH